MGDCVGLDSVQEAAVNHYSGPAMILAGPGSGKTTVITHRIRNLIENHNVPPERIMVITFTKLACIQMRERFLKLHGQESTSVMFGTFHAVFFMILKSVYNYNSGSIIKLKSQRQFVKMQLLCTQSIVYDESSVISDILSEIAKVKSNIANTDFGTYIPSSCEKNVFMQIYNEYANFLKAQRMIDFEDMLIKTYEVLKNNEQILMLWQNKYDFILIDEFQDASSIQFEIMKMLSDIHKNIFVVGDDDQSIYGFRGAAPKVMKSFAESYKDCDIYKLNVNYRSAGNIVYAAKRLIDCNKDRFYKALMPYSDLGCDVEYHTFDNQLSQNSFLADYICGSDCHTAVLTRTNTDSLDLVCLLKEKGIDTVFNGQIANFYSHWIIEDIISYISIALGDNKREYFLRIINKPMRYVNRSFFIESFVDVENVVSQMQQLNQIQLISVFKEFLCHIKIIKNLNPFAGINYIRKAVGYDRYLKEHAEEQNVKVQDFYSVLDRFQSLSLKFDTYEQWLKYIKMCRNMDNEDKKSKYDRQRQKSRVSFCTMHSSKGLEFDTVIIPDVNEGIIPNSKALTDDSIEEERRLFYVAVTRAKKKLIICCVKEKSNKTMQPSRFIRELHGMRN